MEKMNQRQREEFTKVKEMMHKNGLPNDILIRARHLIVSGGIDLTTERKDYSNTKAILAATFRQIADDLIPFTPEGKKDYENLRHF